MDAFKNNAHKSPHMSMQAQHTNGTEHSHMSNEKRFEILSL